jgi:formyl-CoA transferase
MLLAIGNDGQFSRFCEVAGHSEWAHDVRFANNSDRVKNREVLVPLMQAVIRERTTEQWVHLLEHKAVPCGPINDIGQAFADEQVRARHLAVAQDCEPAIVAQTGIASIAGVASPLRLLSTPPVLHRAPPALGQHTDEILIELGLLPAQRDALRKAGVV